MRSALSYHFKGRSVDAVPLLEHVVQTTREIAGEQDDKSMEALVNLFKIQVAAGQGAARWKQAKRLCVCSRSMSAPTRRRHRCHIRAGDPAIV